MAELLPWVFLVVAVWGAVLSINAVRPVRDGVVFVGASFFAGWFTSELALHHLVWQGALTLVFVRWGGLTHPAGVAALVITCASWVALGYMVVASLRDADTVRAALRQALGDEVGARSEMRVDWLRVLIPFWMRRRAVRRVRDIAYVNDGKRRHRLDVYQPRDPNVGATRPGGKHPVLLQIHGGAWLLGSKSQQGLPLMNHMAERGYVCVAINYALSPNATWPEHLIDCKRALKWIRENIADYGGDADFVIVTGGSAGGHLTAMMALTQNDAELQPGFEDVDTSVVGFVPFYGVFDWTNRFGFRSARDGLERLLERQVVKRSRTSAPELFDRASPMSRISDDVPPAMIVHGTKDNLAPVTEARRFVELLRERSDEPVVYVELDGAHHAFEVFHSVRTAHALAGVERFANWLNTRSDRDGEEPDERECQHHAAEGDEHEAGLVALLQRSEPDEEHGDRGEGNHAEVAG